MSTQHKANLIVKEGLLNIDLPIDDIVYLQADHVYVRVFLRNDQQLLIRKSLTWLTNQLPRQQFVQVHRSYAVNLRMITQWSKSCIYLHTREIPVSRSRQRIVSQLLSRQDL